MPDTLPTLTPAALPLTDALVYEYGVRIDEGHNAIRSAWFFGDMKNCNLKKIKSHNAIRSA